MKYKSKIELFKEECKTFKDGMTIEEYYDAVCKYLIISEYGYSVKEAFERVLQSAIFINDSFSRKEPVEDCAIDIGYSCG